MPVHEATEAILAMRTWERDHPNEVPPLRKCMAALELRLEHVQQHLNRTEATDKVRRVVE